MVHLASRKPAMPAAWHTVSKHILLSAFACLTALIFSLCSAHPTQAAQDAIRIGILTDMTGMSQDLGGPGSVVAAQMAADDAGGKLLGRPIVIISADHQNRADIGAEIATRWYDQDHVDVIADVPYSGIALAVQGIAKERHKIALFSGAGSSAIPGKSCTATAFQWTFNTESLARSTGSAIIADGGDTWFFLTADFVFGHSLKDDASAVVTAHGGKVLGESIAPVGTTDFSSNLLAAQASGAKVIGLANASGDTANSIKQAQEFGLTKSGQKLAGLLVSLADVKSIGLNLAQGLLLSESFYWDQNDATREFSSRFAAKMNGRKPTMVQAGVYSAVAHYLKAVKATDTDDGEIVAKKMHELPVNDFMSNDVHIRPGGRVMRDYYLFQVKSPEESKGPWDFYKLIRRIPAADTARPESESGCPLEK